jgi:histidyl-tRNA synthetase
MKIPFRDFRQFGFDFLGDGDAVLDAEIIKIFYLALMELGFSAKGGSANVGKNTIVHINSIGDKSCRPNYKKELSIYYKKKFNYLCKECKRRLKESPLRLLDCKEAPCIEIKTGAPQMIGHLCEGCKTHLKSVLEFLDEGKIPYFLDNYLVRGFDYYSRTVFEFFIDEERISDDAAEGKKDAEEQIALGGGGRYDDLSSLLGGRSVPAAGGSLGMERVVHEMKKYGIAEEKENRPSVFLIHIGPAAKKRIFTLMEELRDAGIKTGESISRDNLKTQLNIAAKVGARMALILGQKEAMDGTILIRDMDFGIQESALQTKLVEKIKANLKKSKGASVLR